MLRSIGLVVVVILVTLGVATPTQADQTKIQCPSGTVVRGICVTQVEQKESVPGADTRAVIGQPRKCLDAGRAISCFHETLGTWSDARACYMTPAKLQPAPGHPVWEARTDGLIYACTHPANPIVLLVWAPASEVVQPRVLAEQLRASMTFEPVSIGIVPEPGPDRLGLVGLPSWMWVANPGPTTLGPQSRSCLASGIVSHFGV